MTNKIYFLLIGVYILIIIVNFNLLKNPKPYPPEEIKKEFKSGIIDKRFIDHEKIDTVLYNIVKIQMDIFGKIHKHINLGKDN